MNKNLWRSLGHAVLVLIYVSIIAFIMSHGEAWFGGDDKPWTPVALLMLFVLSAAVTGSLVLARPVLMYFDGEKKAAVHFFLYTVAWLSILTVIAFIILAMVK